MKQKRGIFFSMDALIALIIILITILIAYPILKYSEHETHAEGDAIKVLSNLKIGEIDNAYVKTLISDGKIKDLNKSILQQIGEFYIENISLAKELANATLSSIDNKNIGLWCQNNIIFLKNSSDIENSKNIRVERQTISGLNDSEDVTGFSARAYLLNNFQTKYFYFGGYVGEGNLSINMDYNGDLSGIEFEIAINNHFNIYINDIYSGSYDSSPSEFTPIGYPNLNAYVSNFHSGNNVIKIVGDNTNNTHVTGGYIKITYENASVYEQPSRYYFPGIEGLINIYDGFYVPNQLKSLNIYLHMNSNLTTFLNIGNITVFENSTGGNDASYMINNDYLLNILNYSQLSSKTIPIRLGIQNVSYVTLNRKDVDVFSLAPLPSSFSSVTDNYGNKKEQVIVYANRVFIGEILKSNYTKVGVMGVDKNGVHLGDVHNLSNNFTSLNTTLNHWNLDGNTWLCYGINQSINSLMTQSNPGNYKSIVIMMDNNPTGTSCGTDPVQDSIDIVCNASKSYGIVFNTIGVGNADHTMLKKIANCSNGTYYESDYTNLADIYKKVSEDLYKLSYSEQTIDFSANGNIKTKLYPDSYIEFNYTKENFQYGIVISMEKQFSNENYGNFSLPSNSTIVETKVVSYSGPKWTQHVIANDNLVYNINNYGSKYIEIGDPYSINIPNNKISYTNNINITTGVSPANSSNGSSSNKIIYKVIKNMSSYSSDIFRRAEGCIWNIKFEDNSNLITRIPKNYSGSENCEYPTSGIISNNYDAVNSAVYNLLTYLDFDSNGKIDLKINQENFEISSSKISGLPYVEYVTVEARTWD